MSANHLGIKPGGLSQFDSFRKRSRSDDYFMIASNELICERAEEWHVR